MRAQEFLLEYPGGPQVMRKTTRLCEREMSAQQVLSYIKKIHPRGEFTIDQSVTDHPVWELTSVPLSSLHIESNDVSPYGQINHINYDHVADITAQDIKNKPIVVDNAGWIIDGNHRAVAAREMGMTHIPAYVPNLDAEDDQETYDQHLARLKINEISRLPKSEVGDWGGKDTLADPTNPVKKKPLPGGSKFTYAVNKNSTGDLEIMIFDGDKLAAEMDLFDTQDFMKTWRVETVVVDPDYRGQGLGKALYGIALSILKLTVEAGESQTRNGQQMWLMLNSIPGVEVKGYNMEPTNKYQPKPGDKVVNQTKDWTRYTFPVKPGSSSMRSGRKGTGIYTTQASMIAKWTGK